MVARRVQLSLAAGVGLRLPEIESVFALSAAERAVVVTTLAAKLDEALFLDGPRFRERLAGPVREPSCLGCYESEPEALRATLSS